MRKATSSQRADNPVESLRQEGKRTKTDPKNIHCGKSLKYYYQQNLPSYETFHPLSFKHFTDLNGITITMFHI